MTELHGYRLYGDLKPNNSGYAKWGFAEKNGRSFFIKEFLSPIYPVDESILSRDQLEKKREICKEFEYNKRVFYNELNKCSTGNVVTVSDFFRFNSKYYMVTEKVDAAVIPIDEIRMLTMEQKELIVRIITYCVMSLHQHGIVHSDIKPDNILFKRTTGGKYTAKIIDFDSSFLETNPPKNDEEFQGDLVYLAPESLLFIAEEDIKLTKKIDVFALGVLFHQYFCGRLPGFDTGKYDYTFEAVLDDYPIVIDSSIPPYMSQIISKMLCKNPEERPSIEYVFEYLTGKKVDTVSPIKTEEPVVPKKPEPAPVNSGGGFFKMPDPDDI